MTSLPRTRLGVYSTVRQGSLGSSDAIVRGVIFRHTGRYGYAARVLRFCGEIELCDGRRQVE